MAGPRVPRKPINPPYWELDDRYFASADVSAFMETLLDDADAATARTTLGLGTASLESYTEGTFTPGLAGFTTPGSPTYSAQEGSYVKVGRLVMAYTYLVVTALGGAAGQLVITGLPFSVRSGTVRRALWQPSFWAGLSLPAGTIGFCGFGIANDTTLRLYRSTITAGSNTVTEAHVSGSLTLYGCVVYEAA